MYNALWVDSSYAARLTNLDLFWLVSRGEHFADSVGMDIESLYVHYNEDNVSITNGGTNRSYDLTILNYKQRRFSYQYWGNTSGDTAMYPAGYCWLANGFNDTTRAALGYSFRRWFVDDSGTYGRGGTNMWTAFFSDNMYRSGYAPRLYTYYTIVSTFGGPTSVMDWYEAGQIENNADTLADYYDNSTLAIIEDVRDSLNAATAAAGSDTIYAFGNVDKENSYMFDVQIKKMNCLLENPLDYTKTWARYRNWIRIADTMANRNPGTGGQADQRYLLWMHMVDFLVDEGTWRTGDRMYMAHYCFHMNMYSPNIYVGMNRFNDTTRWRGIYEVDFGSTFRDRQLTDSAGTGDYGDKNYVMRRWIVSDGGTDSTLVLFRSGYGSNFTTDYVTVSFGTDLYPIDVNADTSGTPISSVNLYVYQGWAGTTASGAALNKKPEHLKGNIYKGGIHK